MCFGLRCRRPEVDSTVLKLIFANHQVCEGVQTSDWSGQSSPNKRMCDICGKDNRYSRWEFSKVMEQPDLKRWMFHICKLSFLGTKIWAAPLEEAALSYYSVGLGGSKLQGLD